jgi:hypothetical protein
MLINMLIKRKPLLRRIRSSEIKKGSCYRCNSEKIVSGRLGDGNTKLNFYPYFDPGHYKWYNEWIFLSCPGVDTETEAKCCTECGLLWTKLRIQWLKHFIIHQCKDVFVTEIYGEKNHSECVDSSQNSIIKTDNEAYCLNCNSKIFITGRLFLYIKHWKRGEVRSVSYSLFFHPNHLKEYKFMLRRGVRVNVNSVCCPECGYIFTDINHEKLKLFLKNNCRKAAASFDIVQKQAGVFL